MRSQASSDTQLLCAAFHCHQKVVILDYLLNVAYVLFFCFHSDSSVPDDLSLIPTKKHDVKKDIKGDPCICLHFYTHLQSSRFLAHLP